MRKENRKESSGKGRGIRRKKADTLMRKREWMEPRI